MGRGPKKHLKRLNAPSHWMLDKLSGKYAPRPSRGPHRLRSCIPLCIVLKNRLKYAMNGNEVKKIVLDRQGHIKVDNVVRRDTNFPLGIMDVLTIEKTGEFFRILIDVKGRFQAKKIDAEEATFKLCKITKKFLGKNKIPYCTTHDGRTIRFQHPDINVHDTIKLSLETGEIQEWYHLTMGALVTVTEGSNKGRIGTVRKIEKHPGSFTIVHCNDSNNHRFATRISNVMVIGAGKESVVSVMKDKGIKLSLIQQRDA